MKNSFLILFALVAFTQIAEAKTKKHHASAVATVTTLSTCEKIPATCSDSSDHTNACKTAVKGKTFQEDAYDSDNAECMRMRLWKKICAQDIHSDGLKVNCH